jgi:hypothetical protein
MGGRRGEEKTKSQDGNEDRKCGNEYSTAKRKGTEIAVAGGWEEPNSMY